MAVGFRMHQQQNRKVYHLKTSLGAQYGMQNPNPMLATIDKNLLSSSK